MTTAPHAAAGLAGSDPAGDVAVALRSLTRRYGGQRVVDDVTLALRPGAITGLIGRNGSGKTTLLRMIAGQERPTAGSIAVMGADPFENPSAAQHLVLIREDQIYPDSKVRDVLAVAGAARSAWDEVLAARLVEAFELPLRRKVKKLSRGMRSALGIVIGLAARAEVTLLDEPTVGLDPVARQIFYDALLADYAFHPRTYLIATHLIDEIATLLEDVVVLDRGRVALTGDVDAVRASVTLATGPRDAVQALARTHGRGEVQALGGRARAALTDTLADTEREAAERNGVHLEPVTLQQLLAAYDGRAQAAATTDGSER